jgi:hypothetical protein
VVGFWRRLKGGVSCIKNLAILYSVLYSVVADLHHSCIWFIKQWRVDGTPMDSGSLVSWH